jgi:hypothetical protein
LNYASAVNDRMAGDTAVDTKDVITDPDVPDSVHPVGYNGFDIEHVPMRADGTDNDNGPVGGLDRVHGQRGRGVLDTLMEPNIECKVEGTHGRTAKVGIDTTARPYMDAAAEDTVGDAGLDTAQSSGRTLGRAATGWSLHTKYPKMTRESDVKERAPRQGGGESVEDIVGMQVQHGLLAHESVTEPVEVEGGPGMAGVQYGLPGHKPVTEPVEVEGDTGIAAAMGLESQVYPAEIPELERKGRRPRGGKRLNLTGDQKELIRRRGRPNLSNTACAFAGPCTRGRLTVTG